MNCNIQNTKITSITDKILMVGIDVSKGSKDNCCAGRDKESVELSVSDAGGTYEN